MRERIYNVGIFNISRIAKIELIFGAFRKKPNQKGNEIGLFRKNPNQKGNEVAVLGKTLNQKMI